MVLDILNSKGVCRIISIITSKQLFQIKYLLLVCYYIKRTGPKIVHSFIIYEYDILFFKNIFEFLLITH